MENAFELISSALIARDYKQESCPKGRILYGVTDQGTTELPAGAIHFAPKGFWNRLSKPSVFFDPTDGALYVERILNFMVPPNGVLLIPEPSWDKFPALDFLRAVDTFCGKVEPKRAPQKKLFSRLHL